MGDLNTHGGPKGGRTKNSEENNPCWKEQNTSFKCLSDNNYDNDACALQFENYKTCREFWTVVQRQRRLKGIRPILPPLEERKQIKADYMATGRLTI